MMVVAAAPLLGLGPVGIVVGLVAVSGGLLYVAMKTKAQSEPPPGVHGEAQECACCDGLFTSLKLCLFSGKLVCTHCSIEVDALMRGGKTLRGAGRCAKDCLDALRCRDAELIAAEVREEEIVARVGAMRCVRAGEQQKRIPPQTEEIGTAWGREAETRARLLRIAAEAGCTTIYEVRRHERPRNAQRRGDGGREYRWTGLIAKACSQPEDSSAADEPTSKTSGQQRHPGSAGNGDSMPRFAPRQGAWRNKQARKRQGGKPDRPEA